MHRVGTVRKIKLRTYSLNMRKYIEVKVSKFEIQINRKFEVSQESREVYLAKPV
jgi:hypothetical protein